MAAVTKRPLLTVEDRNRLRAMAWKAENDHPGHTNAYTKGVLDVLQWLLGEDMTPLMKEVTQ